MYRLLMLLCLWGASKLCCMAQPNSNPSMALAAPISDQSGLIKKRLFENRKNKAPLLQALQQARSNSSTLWIPIQFHVVTKSDSTGGENVQDILDNLCLLNQHFAPMNVEFYLSGPMNYLAIDSLYDITNMALANYHAQLHKVVGVVNVFVNNSVSPFGRGGFYEPNLDVIYLEKLVCNAYQNELTHEMGHFFSLPDTYAGWAGYNYDALVFSNAGITPDSLPSGEEVEKIIRTGSSANCQVAGDGFCDTEPDYFFGIQWVMYNLGCNYVGTAIDPDGVLFNPTVVGDVSPRFVLEEGSNALSSMRLMNSCIKNLSLHNKTLIMVETKFTNGSNTTTMWVDTIGDTDSTDFYVGGPGSNDIIEGTVFDVAEGFINTGNYTLSTSIVSTNAALSFVASPATFAVQGVWHTTTMDSLKVINNSSSAIAAGETINIIELFKDGSTTVNAEVWTRTLPVSLAAGASYTFYSLLESKPTAGGVSFEVATYAPSSTIIEPSIYNFMNLYPNFCLQEFTTEQQQAMLLDMMARQIAQTVSTTPPDSLVTLISPLAGTTSLQSLVHFQWSSVNWATMYYVHIYERDTLVGGPLQNGYVYETTTTGTDLWLNLPVNGTASNYGWIVRPMKAGYYCDTTFQGSETPFVVQDAALTVDALDVGEMEVEIFPNPSAIQQEIQLTVNSTKAGVAHLHIYNTIGQRLLPTQKLLLSVGANRAAIDTDKLPAGVYFITLEHAGQLIPKQLVIH